MSPDIEHCDNLLHEHKPWRVRVYTLGKFEVVRQNEPLRFARKVQRRPLTLLKAIIAFGSQNVSEARLTDTLWPEAPGDAARFALTSAVYRLRRLLGHGELIIRQENRISLDVHRMWVDAWTVERLLNCSEQHLIAGHYDSMVRSVWMAAELYQGSFLSGESAATWAKPYASRLSRWLLRQVFLVAKQIESRERPEDACHWYERCLGIDPCAEDACRQLMLLYHRLGRPAQAIHVYQQCREALSRRLGMNPSPKTEALLQELRAQQAH